MKTISLRQFRDSVADITEPVAVVRRNKDGSITALGAWAPQRHPAFVTADVQAERDGFGHSSPAPKPGRK